MYLQVCVHMYTHINAYKKVWENLHQIVNCISEDKNNSDCHFKLLVHYCLRYNELGVLLQFLKFPLNLSNTRSIEKE